ncbi:glycine-rich protein A3-like [Juglans regia]|uniref:Glycine-rich protein A3-like n=1 Tax=Juglans regia TaxID=51240 RepID=A0A6P9EH76_JUGRE|nr:glycine-rich protein A3-like [Juglans regia]
MGGGKDKHGYQSSDKGLHSNLAGYGAGNGAGYYPPQGYPPQGYLPQGYPPQASYPPSGYPPPLVGYQPAGYPPPGGYPPPAYPTPSAYPGSSVPYHSGYGSMGGLLATGAAAAAAAYGSHQLSHGAHRPGYGGYYGYGHGKLKHGKYGKRWKNGMLGKHKYKKWK